MSRSGDFHAARQDPRALHPNLNEYRDSGMGGESPNNPNVVGYVRTDALAAIHGNETDREGIERHKAALSEGRGFTDPVMVEFDPRNKRAVLGEGNHRVEAARELGITHVPTRVVRSRISDDDMEYMSRKGGTPQNVSVGKSPWGKTIPGGQQWEDYWPSDMHPKHIFPKDTL